MRSRRQMIEAVARAARVNAEALADALAAEGVELVDDRELEGRAMRVGAAVLGKLEALLDGRARIVLQHVERGVANRDNPNEQQADTFVRFVEDEAEEPIELTDEPR